DKRFFTNLNNLNLFDTFTVKYDSQRSDYPTHQGPMSSSRIDYVWSSVDVISNFIGCETVQLASTLTDHSIVVLYIENFLDIKNNKRNIPLKKVYDYDKMTEDNCLPTQWYTSIEKFYTIMNDFGIGYVRLPPNPTTIIAKSICSDIDLLLGCIL
ncbi:9350_t:CDS:2, partial [Funneliformis geosporum]